MFLSGTQIQNCVNIYYYCKKQNVCQPFFWETLPSYLNRIAVNFQETLQLVSTESQVERSESAYPPTLYYGYRCMTVCCTKYYGSTEYQSYLFLV